MSLLTILPFILLFAGGVEPASASDSFSETLTQFIIAALTFGTTWFLIQIRKVNTSDKEPTVEEKVEGRIVQVEEKITLHLAQSLSGVVESLNSCHERQNEASKRHEKALHVIIKQQSHITKLSVNQVMLNNKLLQMEQEIARLKENNS